MRLFRGPLPTEHPARVRAVVYSHHAVPDVAEVTTVLGNYKIVEHLCPQGLTIATVMADLGLTEPIFIPFKGRDQVASDYIIQPGDYIELMRRRAGIPLPPGPDAHIYTTEEA